MSRVLVIVGMEIEARGLARRLGLERVGRGGPLCYRDGVLDVACAGIGAARLASLSEGGSEARLVISTGTCGALAPDLAEGDLVVPEAVVTPAGARQVTARLPGLEQAGTLVCVNEVIETAEAKARLRLATGAVAVDMESAPILDWAHVRGLPAAVLRGVCDTAGAGVPPDLTAAVRPDGRVQRSRALRAVLARPAALVDAIGLRAGSAAALDAVARALGRLAATHLR